MQCSICEKMFAATLSICPSCGAMQTQYSQTEASLRLLSIEKINTSDLQLEIGEMSGTAAEAVSVSSEKEFYGSSTAELQQQIRRGQTTTLLEFPAKKSKDQEWREEIKNRIRQRQSGGGAAAASDMNTATTTESAFTKTAKSGQAGESSLVINLKPKLAEKPNSKPKDVVAEALKRIERSRQKFENDELVADELAKNSLNVSQTESKKLSEAANSTLTLVPSPARKVLPMIEDDGLNNSEDKPLIAKTAQKNVFTVPLKVPTTVAKPKSEIVRESGFDDLDDEEIIASSLKSVRKTSVQQALLDDQELVERVAREQKTSRRSNEDLAPLMPRFIAGAIDAGLCGACVLALHFAFGAMLVTGWLSTAIIFAAVLFMYLTAVLLFANTTFGLRMFGLSVVTAEDGDAPTVSQTLICNAVYLLTLATGGIGLLTVFFSSEQRALHNLLSGTMVIED